MLAAPTHDAQRDAFLKVESSFLGRPWRDRLDPAARALAEAIVQQHGVPDAPHTRAVTDAMAERLTLVGTAEHVRDKIRRLEAAGVTHVCLYLGIVEPEFHVATLQTYGRDIIPHFRGPVAERR